MVEESPGNIEAMQSEQSTEYSLPDQTSPVCSPTPHLTPREIEIMQILSQAGNTSGEVAEKLCISYHTARQHIKNIYLKLEVSDRRGAVRWFISHYPVSSFLGFSI